MRPNPMIYAACVTLAASTASTTCPPALVAPPDDGAGAAASLHCFVQPNCSACVATDPTVSLCGWCSEYSACVHHWRTNCPPSPGAVVNASRCPAEAASAGGSVDGSVGSGSRAARRTDCPAEYVPCVDSRGAPRCAPCAAQCYEFLDPTSGRAARVADLLARLTASEKVSLLNNDAPGIPRLGVQPYTTSECLHGYATMRSANGSAVVSTQFPTPLNLGASFNASLVEAVGLAIGREARAHTNFWEAQGFRGTGLHCLSPNANIARSPLWGRTQEVYGEDPTHAALLVKRYVRGLQQRGRAPPGAADSGLLLAGAVVKHMMVYNLENTTTTDRYAFDALVTAHDVADTYAVMWEAVADEGAVGVMCSYNAVGSTNPASSPVPVCANRFLLDSVLGRAPQGSNASSASRLFGREESMVVSDGNAIQDVFSYHGFPRSGPHGGTIGETVVATVHAGTDMNLGGVYNATLRQSLSSGLIDAAAVELAARRVLLARFKVGEFDVRASVNPYRKIPHSVAASAAHAELAYEAALQGITLLANRGNAGHAARILPLSRAALEGGGGVAVVGPNANDTSIMLGNYAGVAPHIVTPLAGIRDLLHSAGGTVPVRYARGCANVWCTDDTGFAAAVAAASAADVVVACMGLNPGTNASTGGAEGEMMDRGSLALLGEQERLIRALVATGKPVIVVLLNGGQVTTAPWASGVAALVEAHYPGQEGGRALADLLFDANGAASRGWGRLVYSFYASQAVMPQHTSMAFEGDGRTYRYARDDAHTLSFRFGDGMPGFANFSYSGAALLVGGKPASSAAACDNVSLTVTVTNTGEVAGADVVQVYIAGANASASGGHVAPAHVRALAAFARTRVLAPGEGQQLQLPVPHAALSVIVVGAPPAPLAPGTLAPSLRVLQAPRRFVVSVGGSQPRPAGVEWAASAAGAAPFALPGFGGSHVHGLNFKLTGTPRPLEQC